MIDPNLPMSEEYTLAMMKGFATMRKYSHKIQARVALTPEEAEEVLNDNYQVYLYALVENDIPMAKHITRTLNAIVEVVRMKGSTVEFTDKYTVKGQANG